MFVGIMGRHLKWSGLMANVVIEGPEQAQLANGHARMKGSTT